MDNIEGIILAAGRGNRLGPLGEAHVKTLLPVANEPLIAHHLKLLNELGVRRVFVVVGHHADQVELALGTGERYGVELRFIRQPNLLGSAHALASVRPYLRSPVLVMLGDYYFAARDPQVMLWHLMKGESAIATKQEPDSRLIREACTLETGPDGRVLSIVEKPTRPKTNLKGCGFYALAPEAFDAVNRTPRTALRDEYELTVSLELLVSGGGSLYAEEIIDWDSNVTRPEDLLQCNLDWLDRHQLTQLVAGNAFVDAGTQLQEVVVGNGASIRGTNFLKEVVVFPGVELADHGVLERTLITPEGLISCGQPLQAARQHST